MQFYRDLAEQQFANNAHLNIFYDGPALQFSDMTRQYLSQHRSDYAALPAKQQQDVLDILTDGFVRSFASANQYIQFNAQHMKGICELYRELFSDLSGQMSIEQVEQNHYDRIRAFITQSNPLLQRANRPDVVHAVTTVCEEYMPQLQLDVLGADVSSLKQPVLDIGCGESAGMVVYLRSQGVDAYGIDRLAADTAHTQRANWLEYSYGTARWGTILSHLAFSSHVLHHAVNESEYAVAYVQAYFRILQSLMPGGVWLYTPSLRFVEEHLSDAFHIQRHTVAGQVEATRLKKCEKTAYSPV